MPSPIKIKVWSDYACFTRPEMKTERVSYDVITPSAARGVLEAIYWKPQIKWLIDRIHVLNPIQFTNIRRNEVASKISAGTVVSAAKKGHANVGMLIEADRQQRAATILRNPAYIIEAHFELQDKKETIEKHFNMCKRRVEKGQYFHKPYLGCREYPAHFEWVETLPESTSLPEEQTNRDFGFMLYDIFYQPYDPKIHDKKDYIIESNQGVKLHATPQFYRAIMKSGIIEVPHPSHSELHQ